MIGKTVDSHQNPGRAADGTDADETKGVEPADPAGGETRSVERGGSAEAETRILRSQGEGGTYERLNELAVGTRFAGHVIEAEIARGEMGIVYRARNMRLERIEALKVIAPRYAADAGFRARFRREAMHAVIADHPHVVRVYDADEHDGRLYMAMQFVDGVDLRKRLARDGALAPNVAVEITSQVASALDAAHANGLIHRDVKPSNILLAEVSEVPDAYLSDFGVSRRLAMPSDLTQPGSVV
ncbi:MAG: serine/threonine-protein kinase, partial [Solirubrobacteraceae bacterium]